MQLTTPLSGTVVLTANPGSDDPITVNTVRVTASNGASVGCTFSGGTTVTPGSPIQCNFQITNPPDTGTVTAAVTTTGVPSYTSSPVSISSTANGECAYFTDSFSILPATGAAILPTGNPQGDVPPNNVLTCNPTTRFAYTYVFGPYQSPSPVPCGSYQVILAFECTVNVLPVVAMCGLSLHEHPKARSGGEHVTPP